MRQKKRGKRLSKLWERVRTAQKQLNKAHSRRVDLLTRVSYGRAGR